MKSIVHVTNFEARQVVDGGTHREEALYRFLSKQGAARLVVQDSGFRESKAGKLLRLPRLMREIRESGADMVVLNYPSYPFFWQHRVTIYFLMSLVFAYLLRGKAEVVIDVMDLPVFQYKDLGYPIEMSEAKLKWFDRFIFSRADYLWVCSNALSEVIRQECAIDTSRLIVALNGHDMDQPPPERPPSQITRFAYAGSLNPERGMEAAVQAFVDGRMENTELHLCGRCGQWIRQKYSDPRIVYHGELTDAEAWKTLAGCDIGLIPYPERGYYNLAFATKLPFYLALGMPVLCSMAQETAAVVEAKGIGLCRPISRFAEAYQEAASDPEQLAAWRSNVIKVRGEFSWNIIYSRALEKTLGSTVGKRGGR